LLLFFELDHGTIPTCAYSNVEGPGKSQDEQLFEFARSMNREGVPESVAKAILANRLTRPATGVKGVLADYRASCELDAAIRSAEAANRNAILRRMVEGHKIQPSAAAEVLYVGVFELG
jgi:hypothetical protein